MNYKNTPEFEKDLKKLQKKFRTLIADLEVAKVNAIELLHLHNIDNLSIFRIPGYDSGSIKIFKLKKFACKSLKGKGVRSGIRVIYAYYFETHTVEFIEIYYKADQVMENRERVLRYLNKRKE